MASKGTSKVRGFFGGAWRALDATRRAVLNLIFLVILIALAWGMFAGGVKPLSDKTALVLDLHGDLVEQHASGSTRDLLLADARGDKKRDMQLRDVLLVLDAAARDPKIGSVVLLTDNLQGAGQAMLHEVGAALDRVKAAGKPVIAWAGTYDQRQYGFAAHASEVYLHPMGSVFLTGFGGHRNYYRDALDKLGVTVNVMKVGTYKSYAEPYISNGPSDAAQEADSYLYNALWSSFTDDLEKARKLPKGAVMDYIDNLPTLLADAKGAAAQLAVKRKLVDGIKTRDEMRTMLMQRGAVDTAAKSFKQVSFEDYLARQHPKVLGDGVGVVVAVGSITDGEAPAGSIGGLSTANLIRSAREDDAIKAVVLRVDSPGGSAFGAELIRRELELTRAAGKPVVISMGNVAASGGYWVSMSSDEVIADPSTVTGSIGVFALMPTAEKVGEKLGIHTGGVTTTWLADYYNPLRPLDPRFTQLVQESINNVYANFTGKTALARRMTPAQVDAVGQGRVWTGAQAKERGLVDRLGSFNDAIQSAAKRAKLAGDYRIAYIERPSSALDRLLDLLGVSAQASLALQVKLGLVSDAVPAPAVQAVARDLAFIQELSAGNRPFATTVHCLCESP
ncbi:MAG: signal peptide peptidase SppA [Telluria sp.]